MIFIYHPAGQQLSRYALNLWLADELAAALAVFPGGTEITAAPNGGRLLDLGLPNYPWQFEPALMADDRETQGGHTYSRLRFTRRQGTLMFSKVPSAVIPDWRAWHLATQGGRLPFLVQLPDLSTLLAVAPGNFPLALVAFERWSGSLSLIESLA